MCSDAAIRVQGLGKCYRVYERPQDRLKQSLWRGRRQFFREFWALQGVSFDVARGDSVGIIGLNGSGKSTLLQIIAGTLSPTTGHKSIHGRVAALLELGSGFSLDFTGRENVYLNASILGLTKEETRERFDEIASFADIGDFIDQPVKTYSSGMLMRLAFAVSASVSPDILIVDEALAVGDAAFQFKCLERIQVLLDAGTTLLYVSHDMGTVRAICDRTLYLANGQMRADGPADEVSERYLLDVRAQQHRDLGTGRELKPKRHLRDDNRLAFGTDDGEIARVVFSTTGGQQDAFACGEVVRVLVDIRLERSLKKPVLSVIVSDRRMIPVFGRAYDLAEIVASRRPPWQTVIECAFRASLAAGEYFVTAKLEERVAAAQTLIIDKQPGIIQFQVQSSGRAPLLGLVDMEMEFTEKMPQGDLLRDIPL